MSLKARPRALARRWAQCLEPDTGIVIQYNAQLPSGKWLALTFAMRYLQDVSTTPAHLEAGRPARSGQLILERRRRLLDKMVPEWAASRVLLDLGCGNGAQTRLLSGPGRTLVGIDSARIGDLEEIPDRSAFVYVRGSAGDLPLRNEALDGAVSFEVLEHVPDDRAAVLEVARTLKPGGFFLFTVPNKWWVFESHGAVVPGLNFLPWNRIPFVSYLPGHLHERIARARIYTLRRALELARSSGLEPLASGYITAPLDVLPKGLLRRILRSTIFRNDTTALPVLAVNLYVLAAKPLQPD